jgi:hypothetical protein
MTQPFSLHKESTKYNRTDRILCLVCRGRGRVQDDCRHVLIEDYQYGICGRHSGSKNGIYFYFSSKGKGLPITCPEGAKRDYRYIALLSPNLDARWGCAAKAAPQPLYLGKSRGAHLNRLGGPKHWCGRILAKRKFLAPHGDRAPDLPARSM